MLPCGPPQWRLVMLRMKRDSVTDWRPLNASFVSEKSKRSASSAWSGRVRTCCSPAATSACAPCALLPSWLPLGTLARCAETLLCTFTGFLSDRTRDGGATKKETSQTVVCTTRWMQWMAALGDEQRWDVS